MKTYHFTSLPKIIFIIVLCSNLLTLSHPNTKLEEQAKSWLYRYIFTPEGSTRISQNDIQAIVNLIYLSWSRSAITLKAQQEALQTLDIFWKGWQNIAQTRLDPAVDSPYAILTEQQEELGKCFWNCVQQHRSIGITYSYAIKMILEKQILQSITALDGVVAMRDKSRKIIIEALLDIRKQLGEFFHIENKTQEQLASKSANPPLIDPELDVDENKKSISLTNFIYAYIPQLALHSFVEANTTYNLISEEGWTMLKTIQEVGNHTWKAIEDARADFYQIYYTVLFNAVKQYQLPDSCLLLMFNEQGIIPPNEQNQYLAEPTKLILDI